MTHRVEEIQRRAVKWILGEQDHHYHDVEYLSRLRDIDLLPMEAKCSYIQTWSMAMLHNIYYDRSVVKLPPYIVPMTGTDRGRFRSNTRPPERYNQGESSGLPNIHERRNNCFNGMSLKCSVEAKTRSFKSSFFYRTHILWNDLPTELKRKTIVPRSRQV